MSTNKQALRQLAVDAKELAIIKRYTKGIEAQKKFIAAATPATVLALLDELEAAEKRIAELEARDKPKFVQCWSCKHDIEVLAIAECDGYCPRCAAPIDLDDEPYTGITVKGDSE